MATDDVREALRVLGEHASQFEREQDANAAIGLSVTTHDDVQVLVPLGDLRRAAEALAALTEAGPSGWKLVPVEPTEAMLDALDESPWVVAGDKEHRDWRYVVDGWHAMLAAAPEPPASPSPAPTQASPPDEYDGLVDEARRASVAVYLAAEESVARDIARIMLRQADAIQSLQAKVGELEPYKALFTRRMDAGFSTGALETAMQNKVRAESALATERVRALEEAANKRPDRSAGNPPGGIWRGQYEVGWNNAVVAYSAAIRALAPKEPGK